MLAASHVVFGSGLYLLSSPCLGFGYPEVYGFLPLVILGALVPDLDARQSVLKRFWLIRGLFLPLSLLGHRTWTHSLVALVLLTMPLFSLSDGAYQALLAFNIGYGSHIFADWLTHRGVPLFYPSKTAFKSPFPFRTGSMLELPVALLPFLIMAGVYLSESARCLLKSWH
ncbi:metal-dependent hydrolase [Thiomicrorhabdus xiamenensis]|uniref:Metal-dependent hydrolase n=1 Tax=Thiomicrorhabdus xiamenensis TaxID=2739063 RepID=A0A7D4SZ82_9GAMM|nr:metal-dependent hydrolase [Thiomicrorhabdus xiamenensis]QKI88382.1 metal-dependent hydrolase [Thiomicrorhabdus xiamenensis]